LCETMRSLLSPRAKRINGSRKFHLSPKKTFATISGVEQTCLATAATSEFEARLSTREAPARLSLRSIPIE
jgi:hypothetical protein